MSGSVTLRSSNYQRKHARLSAGLCMTSVLDDLRSLKYFMVKSDKCLSERRLHNSSGMVLDSTRNLSRFLVR